MMEISKVSKEDGLLMAHLLQFLAVSNKLVDALKLGGFPISGPGISERERASKWVNDLANKMAAELKKAEEEAPMKIKKMGKLKK